MPDLIPFTERLLAFLPNMRRFAISITGSPDVADDIVQTACERALAHQDSFDPGTRFDAWMFRIIRNLWLDQLRRSRTAGTREDIDDHQDLPGAGGENEVFARMELRDVAEAMGRLQPQQREVLAMVCIEDLSYRDVAEVLEMPIGTVMSRLARARKNLALMTGIIDHEDRSSREKG